MLAALLTWELIKELHTYLEREEKQVNIELVPGKIMESCNVMKKKNKIVIFLMT